MIKSIFQVVTPAIRFGWFMWYCCFRSGELLMFSDLWTSISNESMHIVHKDQMLVFAVVAVLLSSIFCKCRWRCSCCYHCWLLFFGIRGKVTCLYRFLLPSTVIEYSFFHSISFVHVLVLVLCIKRIQALSMFGLYMMYTVHTWKTLGNRWVCIIVQWRFDQHFIHRFQMDGKLQPDCAWIVCVRVCVRSLIRAQTLLLRSNCIENFELGATLFLCRISMLYVRMNALML